jgi:glycosyltransferase involved in cell wall biosynthesis
MLTVLFATRNRAPLLLDVLGAFCNLQSPSSGWKLVIVDNGSTDDTGRVAASFSDRLPLYLVSEPKLGKNFALNAGLELVDGDLTVLTDDDVFPNADWLVQMRKAADTQPEYSLFGGTILPRWEVPPPSWVQWLDLGPIYTLTDPLLPEGPLPPNEIAVIQGPNMAIRTSVFRSGIRFDSSIGPRGSSYPMGSETELLSRLSREGHKGWHVQGAVVEHFVSGTSMSKNWILQRGIRWGRGRQRMSPGVKMWMGIPRHLFRDLPKEAFFMAVAWASAREDDLFRSCWRFNILRGKAIEARILARERRMQT